MVLTSKLRNTSNPQDIQKKDISFKVEFKPVLLIPISCYMHKYTSDGALLALHLHFCCYKCNLFYYSTLYFFLIRGAYILQKEKKAFIIQVIYCHIYVQINAQHLVYRVSDFQFTTWRSHKP